VLLAVALLTLDGPAQARDARPAPVGQDPIVPGAAYAGDFPDPWIVRVGHRYVAYSTTSYGLNLPVLTSTNLHGWVARRATTTAPAGDGLPRVAAWARLKAKQPADGRLKSETGPWAPSVTRLGKHRWVLAYAVQANTSTYRMCISLATSTSPVGPFVDRTTGPTVCPRNGAIDPQVFVAPSGRPWLVWKRDLYPARLVTQPMTRSGSRVLAHKSPHFLAKVKQAWEGSIIENPAMIRYQDRYYLFYSANSYASTRYAIGYLICKSWKGDCTRPRKKPLLATGGAIAGPGGPAPFVDRKGRLRLGYHAWSASQVGYADVGDPCAAVPGSCGQRRLYVAKLGVKPNGRLRVLERY
jgi:beta-xylosidase